MNFYTVNESRQVESVEHSFSDDSDQNARNDKYELLLNDKCFEAGHIQTPFAQTQHAHCGGFYVAPVAKAHAKNPTILCGQNVLEESIEQVGVLELWEKYNSNLKMFDDFYEGKSERNILQSIFHNITKIARMVGISRADTPVGVLCTEKDDLIKLDILLLRVQSELAVTRSRRESQCSLL